MDTVRIIVHELGRVFSACPFVVAGISAMNYYGFDTRHENHIVINCPYQHIEAVRAWGTKTGRPDVAANPSGFGIRTDHDGRTRHVRIVYTECFENLHSVLVGPWDSPVLSVPAIVNLAACSYLECTDELLDRQPAYAVDIKWLLIKSIELGTLRQRCTRERVPDVVRVSFWKDFTGKFPETVSLFRKSGLHTPVE